MIADIATSDIVLNPLRVLVGAGMTVLVGVSFEAAYQSWKHRVAYPETMWASFAIVLFLVGTVLDILERIGDELSYRTPLYGIAIMFAFLAIRARKRKGPLIYEPKDKEVKNKHG